MPLLLLLRHGYYVVLVSLEDFVKAENVSAYLEVAVVTMIGLVSEKSRKVGSRRGCRVGSKISTYMYNTCGYMQGTKWVNVDKLVAYLKSQRDVIRR